jgi:uncharacterized protein YigE (DUF2233 family)
LLRPEAQGSSVVHVKRPALGVAWLAVCLLLWFAGPRVRAAQAEKVSFEGKDYTVFWVDLATDKLGLYWRDDQDKPFGSFSNLRKHLAAGTNELRFAMNAGIYATNQVPLGLHVENARELHPLELGNRVGRQFNFFLKPNGVFYVADNKAFVLESVKYSQEQPHPALACQSGPLLVSGGAIHPTFQPNSTNRHPRNAVGVAKDGKVVFVITKAKVTFHELAQLFRDRLKCDDALYLDGNSGAIYLPELGFRTEGRKRYAGIFGVLGKPE